MATWTTFITQPIYDFNSADILENNLKKYRKHRGKMLFSFKKHTHGDRCVYFSGISAESIDNFYTWFDLMYKIDKDLFIAFATDEKSAGYWPKYLT